MIEKLAPLKVKHRRLRVGTGGKGRHRGGNGLEIAFESTCRNTAMATFLAERTRAEAAPAGVAGGEAGAAGEVLINGKRVDPKAQHLVEHGTTIELRTPGGGGFGPARERAHEAIESDRLDGYVIPA